MTPPPEHTHDNIVSRLTRVFIPYLNGKGDKDRLYVPRAAIWTSARTYLEPVLFYVSAELEAQLDPTHRTTTDLIVEVISPGSAIYDRNTKADTYGALGVRELWLVDETEETVEVRRQTGEEFDEGNFFHHGEQIESGVWPDHRLNIEQLFTD